MKNNGKLLRVSRCLSDLQLPTAGGAGKMCIFDLNSFFTDSLPLFAGQWMQLRRKLKSRGCLPREGLSKISNSEKQTSEDSCEVLKSMSPPADCAQFLFHSFHGRTRDAAGEDSAWREARCSEQGSAQFLCLAREQMTEGR